MKQLPSADELEAGFRDFANFSLELIGRADASPRYLQFAAVNAQVALELFLKFFYTKQGAVEKIQKKKNNRPLPDFIDHSQILNLYYSDHDWSYGVKKELAELSDVRNKILHKAQRTEWNNDLAVSIVRTIFFIHSTLSSEFDLHFFEQAYGRPHELAYNGTWQKGVESFISHLTEELEIKIYNCTTCHQRTVITNEFFALGGAEGDTHLMCLNCFIAINTEFEARVIRCYACNDHSYLIDSFNVQPGQYYFGRCTECDECQSVRRCAKCENFFHPHNRLLAKHEKFYCSSSCLEHGTE